jgi:hypothetical protein
MYVRCVDLGPILNSEIPKDVPLRPMGSIPVIARLVLADREEWRPAVAIRWTPTHVMVRVEEHRPGTPIKADYLWLPAADVTRAIRQPRDRPAPPGPRRS